MNAVLQWGMSLINKSPLTLVPTERGTSNQKESFYRSVVISLLKKLQGGRLAVFENDQVHVYGQLANEGDINASINIHDAGAWQMMVTRGSIGAGEAYMEGYWTSPDLTQVVRLLVRNREVLNALDGQQSLMARLALKAIHAMNRNTREGAQKNIRAHYDLNNDFFQLFLDPSMMYSSAVFRHPAEPLAEASAYKLDMICQQLELRAEDHLIEIGAGWGGMAIHAVKHYGCRVTTTTISQEQYDFAKARIEREGLADRITLLLQDYRELTGSYDKLVSIEMIEAVGAEFQQGYFEICSQLLKPGGKALIQAINLGADEALMLDPRGFVASCNSTNFFIVRGDDELWTSTGNYSFKGITQANVIRAWQAAGGVVRECDFTLAQVYSAKEAFVTGTLGGVTPVTKIDGRMIGDGRPGPVTERASGLYGQYCEQQT